LLVELARELESDMANQVTIQAAVANVIKFDIKLHFYAIQNPTLTEFDQFLKKCLLGIAENGDGDLKQKLKFILGTKLLSELLIQNLKPLQQKVRVQRTTNQY